MTIEVWLTVGLLFSAASQAALQGWAAQLSRKAADDESDRRRKEHNAGDIVRRRIGEAEQDTSFLEVWAESFRVESIANQWDEQDLVELSTLGLLDPLTIKPADASSLTRSAARLGHESGYLVGVAITLASDIAHQVAVFNRNIEELAGQFKAAYPGAHAYEVTNAVKGQGGKELQERATHLRRGVRDLALLLWDAARHSPRADVNRSLNFRDDMQSTFARDAAKALAERERGAAKLDSAETLSKVKGQ